MLSGKNRLKKKKDFDRVFSRGKALSAPLFLVKSADNDLEVSRFGIILSKKVSNKAVVRNRIRRIIRGAIRAELEKVRRGVDIIFIIKPVILKQSALKIREEVGRVLGRLS